MTERLYYHDSFLHEFDACVVEVVECGGQHALVLDRTAFYPTSGGQVFDTGILTAGGAAAALVEVAEDESGRILHYVETLPAGARPGAEVHGQINAPRRRDHMQQHSGQHVLSAAFVRLFQMPTVSFHMGEEFCTIDLGARGISAEQLEAASRLANEVVTDDRPVEIRFADAAQARALGVRKMPEGKERLRLIEIRDFDLTACGGTHVHSTGQIGSILVRKTENVKQGVRVEFVCGGRALRAARRDFTALTEAAAAFSAHIYDLPQQVRKTQEDLRAASKAQQKLLEELAELLAARLLSEAPGQRGFRLLRRVFADRDAAFAKLVAQKATAAQPAVALLASVAGPATLVFAQTPGLPFDMGALMKSAMSVLGGRGGGNKDFAQGGVPDGAQVEQALEKAAHEIADRKS